MMPLPFRCWHEQDQQMLEVKQIDFEHQKFVCRLETSEALHRVVRMQSTGLTDKDKTELFERDILKNDAGRLFEIRWNEGCAAFWLYEMDDGPDEVEPVATQMTCVGNVFQNPELVPYLVPQAA